MSRILALILGIVGLLTGSYLPDLGIRPALPAASPTPVSAESPSRAQPSDHALEHSMKAAEPEALHMRLVNMESSDADQVVYARGDAGVALRGADVSAHVDGTPVSSKNVKRMGNGVQVYDQSALVAEVAFRATPSGLAVDWIWAPQSYYAVTFPSLGVRVTGMRSDPGEESTDALRVTDVDPGSPAETSGLTAGSCIDAIFLDTPSTHESLGEMPATPLALRQAFAHARRSSSPMRLRIQPSETDNDPAGRVIAVSPGSTPIQ
jgi:hypothetical protein